MNAAFSYEAVLSRNDVNSVLANSNSWQQYQFLLACRRLLYRHIWFGSTLAAAYFAEQSPDETSNSGECYGALCARWKPDDWLNVICLLRRLVEMFCKRPACGFHEKYTKDEHLKLILLRSHNWTLVLFDARLKVTYLQILITKNAGIHWTIPRES